MGIDDNVQEERQQEHIIEEDIQELMEDLPEVSDNSEDNLNSDEGQCYPYDEEENNPNISEDSSLEDGHSILGRILEDDAHNNKEIIGDSKQLELRRANKSNDSSQNITEEKHQEVQEDLDTDDTVGRLHYNLRSRIKIDYTNIYNHIADDEITDKDHYLQLLQNAVSNMNKGGPT